MLPTRSNWANRQEQQTLRSVLGTSATRMTRWLHAVALVTALGVAGALGLRFIASLLDGLDAHHESASTVSGCTICEAEA